MIVKSVNKRLKLSTLRLWSPFGGQKRQKSLIMALIGETLMLTEKNTYDNQRLQNSF
jgi:hypothetical protein